MLVHGLVTCRGRSRGSCWYVASRFVTRLCSDVQSRCWFAILAVIGNGSGARACDAQGPDQGPVQELLLVCPSPWSYHLGHLVHLCSRVVAALFVVHNVSITHACTAVRAIVWVSVCLCTIHLACMKLYMWTCRCR